MKRFFTILVAAFALASCTQDEVDQKINLEKPTYYASFADAEAESRTYLDENLKLLWHNDDRISLFATTTYNEEYAFVGTTGSNSGAFEAVDNDSWVTGNPISTPYAVYPYNENNALSNSEVLTIYFQAEQTYMENSFGRGANTMVAAAESATSKLLPFRNAGGYLMLKLYGEGAVKSIELKGNNEEILSGAATAEARYGYLPAITMGTEGGQTITLNCEEAVTLGATEAEATVFWLVVPPITFEQGFTITVTDAEGGTFVQATSKEVVIERNEIKSMAPLAPNFEGTTEDPEEPKPANNEIWYTATQKCSVMGSIYYDSYGADLVLDECVWDEETGKGVIKFDGPINRIRSEAFILSSDYIASIILPDGITEIAHRAFVNCKNLKEINIPNSVTTIGISAFAGCNSLTSIKIPKGVTTIRESLFSGCENLTDVVLPNSITSIEGSAFSGCQSLENIKLPENLTSLGNATFYGCTKLQSVTIPDGVTTIGTSTFYLCYSLETLIIGKGVVLIDENATYRCSTLKEIYCTALVPPALFYHDGYDSSFPFNNDLNMKIYVPHTSYDTYMQYTSYASNSCSQINWSRYQRFIEAYDYENGAVVDVIRNNEIWYTATTKVEPITNAFGVSVTNNEWDETTGKGVITFNGDVTTIGDEAFKECTTLKQITLPYCVASIGNYAFSGCRELSIIDIPNSVTTIGIEAFKGCSKLITITLGSGLTSIGDKGFLGCSALKNVYCKAVTPPTLGTKVFYKADEIYNLNCKVYVPINSFSVYDTTIEWNFLDIIAYEF